MNFLKENKALIIVAAMLVGLVGYATISNKSSQDAETSDATSQAEPNAPLANSDQPKTATAAEAYRYTAKSGDSYTLLARKAVQQYSQAASTDLSPAQRIAAETVIARTAGSPDINEGATIVIDPAIVKSAVEFSQGLSAEDKAAWEIYVPSVDFTE